MVVTSSCAAIYSDNADLDDYHALYEAVEAETDDPTVALRAGKVVSIELFDPALFAAICSPDMNTAATRLGQFKRLVGQFSLEVDVGADQTSIRYRCKHRLDVPQTKGLSEMVLLVAFARRATRHAIVPRRLTAQSLPLEVAPYAEYFGCPIDVGPAYTVAFAARDASRPFLTHNARMWETFEPTLRRRMSQANEQRTTSDAVEAALFELLPSGRTRLQDAAKELGMGTRTLQRRLASENTSWLEVHQPHARSDRFVRPARAEKAIRPPRWRRDAASVRRARRRRLRWWVGAA